MALVPDRARPFVAALLGLLVTGFGHLYLRRWLRAVGWFALAFAVSVAFVPETAALDILAGDPVDPAAILPGALVGIASAIDAFIVARREVSAKADRSAQAGAAAGPDGTVTPNAEAAAEPERVGDEEIDCPACGKPVDPDLGFCHWCTTEFVGGGTDDANNAN
jgi:hypothetical protein